MISKHKPTWFARALLLVLLLVYWTLSLPNLTVLPRVYEDEPWQSSTALKLAREGIFGSDLFAGYAHMEQRYYDFLPVYPLVLSLVIRVADVGLFQARWFGIVCGVLILALTFSLAQRVWRDERIGVLAILFLLSVCWIADNSLHPTGVLLWDATRIARYDVLVPVFGLLALHAFFRAQATQRNFSFFVTGFLVGLGGLTHLYGLFLFPVIVILMVWQRPRAWWRQLFFLSAGVMLPWLFYLMYVLGDVQAWRDQTRSYAPRFDLLNPNWYLENVRTELNRYAFSAAQLFPVRPGVWFALAALIGSWFALLGRVGNETRPRIIFVSVTFLPIAYALLLKTKFTNYLLFITPFSAILVAWGIVALWDRFEKTRWVRIGIVFAILLVLGEAGTRWIAFQAEAALTTPYATLNARLREFVPPGTRVLGLQRYWFGWQGYEYRSLAVPFFLVSPKIREQPVPLQVTLDQQRPDFLLIDDAARPYLEDSEWATFAPFQQWMQEHHAQKIDSFADAYYGSFEIYRVTRAP